MQNQAQWGRNSKKRQKSQENKPQSPSHIDKPPTPKTLTPQRCQEIKAPKIATSPTKHPKNAKAAQRKTLIGRKAEQPMDTKMKAVPVKKPQTKATPIGIPAITPPTKDEEPEGPTQ